LYRSTAAVQGDGLHRNAIPGMPQLMDESLSGFADLTRQACAIFEMNVHETWW
jgi:hypothetical protein